MKSVTEFANHILVRGNEIKAALAAEGKTPEEIQGGLGAAFKYEGDRLKHLINALEAGAQNANGLRRVIVMSLSEGETAPARSLKVDDFYYVPESRSVPIPPERHDAKGGRGGKGGRPGGRGGGGGGRGPGGGGGMRESPWGLSPEQKAAKKGLGKGAGTGGGKA